MAVAIALVVAACGGSGSGSSQTSAHTGTGPAREAAYGSPGQYANLSPAIAKDQKHPYIKGKLVFFWGKLNKPGGDPTKGELSGIGPPDTIDYGWDSLGPKAAPDLHPTNPAQIGTIATVFCRPAATGRTYSNGVQAYNAECSVTILDKAANRIVGTKVFTFPPPDSISCPAGRCQGGEGVGSYSPEKLAAYIESLPRRP